MSDEIIGKSLNIVPEGEVILHRGKSSVGNTDSEKDFEYSRENLKDLIENGSLALDNLLDVARQSQHPSAYEVIATLMNTLISANKDLLEIRKRQQLIKKNEVGTIDPEDLPTPGSITNNNLFVGSTSQLARLIKDLKKEDAA